ncbi:class I SAM-dependent methyltransferase [Paenibacillus mucilaginosus]|uniref:class I SAM-dependent methyltransferase n=1 Tax=Paenibacillus mucilaginosus TaxID=61624 RepID=UPI001EE65D9E|nr:class I SAM-dependent methyltransferase [Paenibacillus mucilaginosus]
MERLDIERINHIRIKEKEYHDDCYDNVKLFQAGSWLQKPVKSVMEALGHCRPSENLQLLDLGCGVGRNSIPLAERMGRGGGKIVCVDLLPSAISHLNRYAAQYGVADRIEGVVSDIRNYRIPPDAFDYMFSVSALEHLETQAAFDGVLTGMMEGTRAGGVHCLLINANITETAVDTGESLDPMFELLFETDELLARLSVRYHGWRVLQQTVKSFVMRIKRDGRPVKLGTDVVTWAVQKI